MKLVFVSAPYRASSILQVHDNIHRAEEIARLIWESGHAALCSHKNTAYLDGLVPDAHFLAGAIRMLKTCDAVYLGQGWEKSEGSRLEHEEAVRIGLPLFDNIPAYLAWAGRQT